MINIFTVSGRIVRDVELRKTPNGKNVTTVTIANETGWGDNKKTHYFDVVLFEQKAEYASRYGSKGQIVEVSGELHQRKYTDKNGNNRTHFEVQQIRTFDLIPTGHKNSASDDDFSVISDEDIPF